MTKTNCSDPMSFVVKKDNDSLFITKCKGPIPGVSVIIQSFKPTDIIIHVILVLMTAITIGIFVDHILYLKTHIKTNYKRRRMSMLLAGIPPVFTTTAAVGIFFPKGNLMIEFVCSVYFGFAIHTFLNLMVNYYGGVTSMIERLQGVEITTRTMPLCCVCFFLPKFQMDKKKFRILYYATLQAAVSRPIVLFFRGVLVLDTTFSTYEMAFMIVLMMSMLVGMWALVILRKSSEKVLAHYHVIGKFFTFQSLLLILNLQPFIINMISLPCIPPYTSVARILVVNYQIVIVEVFILSFIMNCLYRRKSDAKELSEIDGQKRFLRNVSVGDH